MTLVFLSHFKGGKRSRKVCHFKSTTQDTGSYQKYFHGKCTVEMTFPWEMNVRSFGTPKSALEQLAMSGLVACTLKELADPTHNASLCLHFRYNPNLESG